MVTVATLVPMATITPIATIVPMAPVASLAPMAPLNGDASYTFYTRHFTLKSMAPLESFVLIEANRSPMLPLGPLTPMASMKPMNRHSHQ